MSQAKCLQNQPLIIKVTCAFPVTASSLSESLAHLISLRPSLPSASKPTVIPAILPTSTQLATLRSQLSLHNPPPSYRGTLDPQRPYALKESLTVRVLHPHLMTSGGLLGGRSLGMGHPQQRAQQQHQPTNGVFTPQSSRPHHPSYPTNGNSSIRPSGLSAAHSSSSSTPSTAAHLGYPPPSRQQAMAPSTPVTGIAPPLHRTPQMFTPGPGVLQHFQLSHRPPVSNGM